ncbi:hypothetical protein AC623_04695 [Bacillus sp. FJAT-27231]|uniref:DUF3238 domain-containing protein n=1 Tax=Bacillus sp. FJAT-27231 TaxID=1679168 RepID=UPI0006713975|nr:DUF3238 domain-containing protein [Bacillus sp. FJAT-27231]KMY53368.1 hypothetical protein AC623_04695 [Bacillus sp. FJAT-27231]
MYRYSIAALGLAGSIFLSWRKRRQQRLARINSLMIKSIKQRENEITFHWMEGKGAYKVYREDELIYSGTDQEITDTGLVPGKTYLYTVKKMGPANQLANTIKIQTSTVTKDQNPANVLQNLIVTTIVTHSVISMEWEPIEGVKEYTVYRNGEKIAKVKDCRFIDDTIESDKDYHYSIKAARPLALSEKTMSEEKFAIAGIIGFFKKDTSEKEAVLERFSLTKQIGMVESVLRPREQASDRTEWAIRYTTFLTNKWLKNPNFFSTLRYFEGDGRGFDPEAPNYRTRADILINYDGRGPNVRLVKDVGKTKAYGWIRRFKEEETASAEGIQLKKSNVTNKEASIQLIHSVGNPLVASPAIDYKMHVRLYKNGFYDISGVHDQSPHQEVYLKNNYTSWQPIHQAESKGLEWLSTTMADQFWRVSNFK